MEFVIDTKIKSFCKPINEWMLIMRKLFISEVDKGGGGGGNRTFRKQNNRFYFDSLESSHYYYDAVLFGKGIFWRMWASKWYC